MFQVAAAAVKALRESLPPETTNLLIAAALVYVCNLGRKLIDSVEKLNLQIAMVVAELKTHDQRITRIEDRI